MKPPKFDNIEEYFAHNKDVWDKSDDSPLKMDKQVIVEVFSFPEDGYIHLDNKSLGFKSLYYRAVYKGVINEKHCVLETLAGSYFSSVVVEQVRIVPDEHIWDVDVSLG